MVDGHRLWWMVIGCGGWSQVVVDGHRLWLMVLRGIGWNWYIEKSLHSFSHNHASGKWLYLKGRYYWRYTHF